MIDIPYEASPGVSVLFNLLQLLYVLLSYSLFDAQLFDCLTAISCPKFVFRVVSSRETSVGTVVNVSCPAGEKLQTGDKMMTTVCSQSGDWRPQIRDCVGKLYFGMSVVYLPFKSTFLITL